jgi:hypothetical protein
MYKSTHGVMIVVGEDYDIQYEQLVSLLYLRCSSATQIIPQQLGTHPVNHYCQSSVIHLQHHQA